MLFIVSMAMVSMAVVIFTMVVAKNGLDGRPEMLVMVSVVVLVGPVRVHLQVMPHGLVQQVLVAKERMRNDGLESKFPEVRVMMVVVISNIFVMWSVHILRDVDIIALKVRVEFFTANIRMAAMAVVALLIRLVISILPLLPFG